MDLFSALFPVVGFGAASVTFHVLDHQCRRSPSTRSKIEKQLASSVLTEAQARGYTRGYRAAALAGDSLFVTFLGWLLTPILPAWDDLLAVGILAGLLFGGVFMAMALAILHYNRPRWLVQPERRAESGVQRA